MAQTARSWCTMPTARPGTGPSSPSTTPAGLPALLIARTIMPRRYGVGPSISNNHNSVRFSTALGYLGQCRHRLNLTIRPNCMVHRILFDGKRAVGVAGDCGGETFSVAGAHIVLSAGAIGSPQLLMLSGVGPANQLCPRHPGGAGYARSRAEPPGPSQGLCHLGYMTGMRWTRGRPVVVCGCAAPPLARTCAMT